MAAPTSQGEHVYATLLLNDSYLPGALVLAHSLRDAGTSKKLAVLVTVDSVTADAITQLETVYDYVLPVPRLFNDKPANLYLMNRADLHSAFTKVNLWKQTQFSRIVYIDADVVAYRAPDELFDLPHAFAAAPDIGWPDIFNTGVMVLTPNMGDFYALSAMAERGISFDGADQGLLNMYFKNGFHRLPFTYNVTPSAHYQYLPAYRHFQSSINMVHFIGTNKPWISGRHASYGSSAYDEMVGRWWAVYDRHYREQESSSKLPGSFDHQFEQRWDAQRQSPPLGSKPEAINFPSTHYEMSRDTAPFVPPEKYPSPPRGIGYVPPTQAPKPIFPWEGQQPIPSRSFVSGKPSSSSKPAEQEVPIEASSEQTAVTEEPQPPAELPASASVATATQSESSTPTTPTKATSGSPWTSFARTNAWDDVPGIDRYVQDFEKHRRTKSRSSKGAEDGVPLRGLKLTDFPSEVERPSLPVTPAPIRRPSLGSQGQEPETGDDGRPLLPAAEGVPAQSEWDPTVQLQKLAEQQSEVLLRKLGGDETWSSGVVTRDVESPTRVAQSSPKLVSPQPVKGAAAVTTTTLERKMDKGDIETSEAVDTATATETS